jgi:Mrp family chromosome partitioning ATPase
VVIDAAPIGLVSDTFYLTPLADAILLIIRSNKTLRSIFEKTITEISNSNVNGISLVINDINLKKTQYGYGEKYGYTDEAPKRSKLFHWMGKKQ